MEEEKQKRKSAWFTGTALVVFSSEGRDDKSFENKDLAEQWLKTEGNLEDGESATILVEYKTLHAKKVESIIVD